VEEASQVSISQQNPVRVFVSHAFEPSDDYHRVFEYLESSHNFFYRNCSDPEQRGTGERDKLKDELRRQISLAEVVIVPSGQYAAHREWIDFQLNCAKGLDKAVIVLETFGVKQKMPVQLEALADEIVEWNERSIADAIRRQLSCSADPMAPSSPAPLATTACRRQTDRPVAPRLPPPSRGSVHHAGGDAQSPGGPVQRRRVRT
jgi:hypothetical protein